MVSIFGGLSKLEIMPAGGGTAGPSRSLSSCPDAEDPVDVAITAEPFGFEHDPSSNERKDMNWKD